MRRLAVAGVGVLLAAFVLLQLFPAERTNPPVEWEIQAPDDVHAIFRRSCYDCHSHETDWPWYSRVAPLSWWVVDHVEHGRSDLNFSRWPAFDPAAQEDALRAIAEEVSEGEMPLASYLLVHRGARLSDADRARIVAWARAEP